MMQKQLSGIVSHMNICTYDPKKVEGRFLILGDPFLMQSPLYLQPLTLQQTLCLESTL